MKLILAIGMGGFCGAIARHGFNLAFKRFADFPWSTFAANMTGCLLIGLLMALVLDRKMTSETMSAFLVTGFLGSLTTFSTFSMQSLELIQAGRFSAAMANILLNVIVGLSAVFLGMKLVRVFFSVS
jgi:CrcB protein